MLIGYFTEQPYAGFSGEEALRVQPDDHPFRRPGDTVLLFSNKFFDPVVGARLYAERIREGQLAEEVGFDALMTNEHHNGAFCMQPRCNIASTALAVATKTIKIMQLGNPLPLWDNPVQLAEEIGMLDMISQGRLISGIVRGGGAEQLANDVNPVRNRARFVEAHDLLIKTWTTPGPFRWDGEEYQIRVVNPWALPLQKPHPRIFVPGVASLETVIFAAQQGYPYVCLGTSVDDTLAIKGLYAEEAARQGYEAGTEHLGYVMRCHVADTEEQALAGAREFQWMQGEFTGVGHPVWTAPTGYSSWEARQKRNAMHARASRPLEEVIESGSILCGTPKTVIPRIRRFLERTRPGSLVLWGNDGKVDHRNSMRCIELLGQEVLPAVRELGRELGLSSPFDLDAPVSLRQRRELEGLAAAAPQL
ncbi:LLM class flavin-dependent oxidoreductase [Phenylobacterium sp.]|jgi:alkanesulfonate monooxygenase SsuD/methylene tetrahydromethanopterin reductase-like flavin-dependent oxidoreductase (luciferase family)|uniref:LLM class flavin-dependent oxidoreductase n=1 Tax=Phenylobacterium sp. TaxID=1871053 RepID=UPI002F404CD3